MNKKQISLKSLKVKSFITAADQNSGTVKGGSAYCNTAADPFFCTSYDNGGGNGGGTGGSGSCGCSQNASCQGNCTNLANTCGCPVTLPPGCNTDFACTISC